MDKTANKTPDQVEEKTEQDQPAVVNPASENLGGVAGAEVSDRQDPEQTTAVEKPYVPQKDQPKTSPLTEKIMKTTFTKNQLLRRIRLLNDFISFRLFRPEGIQSKDLREQIMKFFATHSKGSAGELDVIAQEADWLNSLEESFFARFTKENFNVAFDSLEKELSNAVPVILYLPFFMPEVRQLEVGKWFKDNIGPHMLFETNFNPNLVGGCAVSYRGEMRDYSILGKIDANKQLIINNLKSFKKG